MSFLCFVKWYFKYTRDKRFCDERPAIQNMKYIRKSERLFVVIFAYFLMVLSPCFLLIPVRANYWLLIFGEIISIILLAVCEFSFLYYFFVYVRFTKREVSINDRAIAEEIILQEVAKDVRKTISKHYRILEVRGNIFVLKYYLTKLGKRKGITRKDIRVLKIKPQGMVLDGKKIFCGKMQEIATLDSCLLEEKTHLP